MTSAHLYAQLVEAAYLAFVPHAALDNRLARLGFELVRRLRPITRGGRGGYAARFRLLEASSILPLHRG